jgi:hypothetical protein
MSLKWAKKTPPLSQDEVTTLMQSDDFNQKVWVVHARCGWRVKKWWHQRVDTTTLKNAQKDRCRSMRRHKFLMSDTHIPICNLREYTYRSNSFGWSDGLSRQLRIRLSTQGEICESKLVNLRVLGGTSNKILVTCNCQFAPVHAFLLICEQLLQTLPFIKISIPAYCLLIFWDDSSSNKRSVVDHDIPTPTTEAISAKMLINS